MWQTFASKYFDCKTSRPFDRFARLEELDGISATQLFKFPAVPTLPYKRLDNIPSKLEYLKFTTLQ